MIKEHKNHLFSDRLSCLDFGANQFRLFLHSIAYILMHAMRDSMLSNTSYARSQFDSIRLHFLKISARVIEMTTKIKIHVAGSYPLKDELTRMLIAGFVWQIYLFFGFDNFNLNAGQWNIMSLKNQNPASSDM